MILFIYLTSWNLISLTTFHDRSFQIKVMFIWAFLLQVQPRDKYDKTEV